MIYEYLSLSAIAEMIFFAKASLVGITGSSSAGKTTLSLTLQQVLQQIKPDYKITVIHTDNFIYSNAYLEANNLMQRKGFPESFDFKALRQCMQAVGAQENTTLPIWTPCYSQDIKDIVPGKKVIIDKSDIYLFEGVNLFFSYNIDGFHASQYLDFSIYLDTERQCIKERALKRFWNAYEQSKIKPAPYFDQFTGWTDEAIYAHAEKLWEMMDMELLKNYIEPYKSLANIVLKSYN